MDGYNLDSDRPHLQVSLGKVYTLAQLAVTVGHAVYTSFDVGCYSTAVVRHLISLTLGPQMSKRAGRQWTADQLYLELLNPRAGGWEAVLSMQPTTIFHHFVSSLKTHLCILIHRNT